MCLTGRSGLLPGSSKGEKRTKRAPAESPVAKCRKACEVAPGGLEVTDHSQCSLSSLTQPGRTLGREKTYLPAYHCAIPSPGLLHLLRIWSSGCGCGGGRNAGRSRDIRDKDLGHGRTLYFVLLVPQGCIKTRSMVLFLRGSYEIVLYAHTSI